MTLEDIGENDRALLCVTDKPACCRPPYTDATGEKTLGNWFFPNETRVPSSGSQLDFHRTRGHIVVTLNRSGEDRVYYLLSCAKVCAQICIGVLNALCV